MSTNEAPERPAAHVPTPDLRSDAEIAREVSETLSAARREPADSFVLHAPLELLARIGLLRFVRDDRRAEARARIVELGEQFRLAGEELVSPPPLLDVDDAGAAADRLIDAMQRGELDDVDAAAAALGARGRPDELAPLLADAVLPSLAAAGHAPIFLWLYPRLAPQGDVAATMLRQLCRELARHPDWRLHWVDRVRASDEASADDLARALAATPVLGRPHSSFIQPLMSRIDRPDRAGALAPLVGGASVAARGRAVLRVAARSMLHDPGEHAPYGWSHCLTMPQAVLGVVGAVADPSRALAVAASHVYGFRASLASTSLGEFAPPDEPATGALLEEALAAGPAAARAAVWWLPDADLVAARTAVATAAAIHHDAHLVKYVLACIDAAADDRRAERLFLAAAATLCGWWAARPDGVEIA